MKKTILVLIAILACVAFLTGAAVAESVAAAAGGQTKAKLPKNLAGLNGPFDLAGELKPEVRYYIQESAVVRMGVDGKRISSETFTLKLKCVPAVLSGKGGDEYTCAEMRIRSADGTTAAIPALAGWTYVFKSMASGLDDQGQVFGIPHAKFEGLVDSRGAALSAIASYPVYNSFIDFHGFNDVFARPIPSGKGIQDLKTIGQGIIHSAAGTEPPVNLGKGIKKGSFFKNGEVVLVLKGLGLVDGAACAVIGFDSGESTLKMIMPMTADKDIVTVGGSDYLGDIYVDLATRWVRKVTLDEFVLTETSLPAMGQGPAAQGQKILAYNVRHLRTRMVSREEFEK